MRVDHERIHLEVPRELLDVQLRGMAGTCGEQTPYASLVGFAATETSAISSSPRVAPTSLRAPRCESRTGRTGPGT